MKLMRWITVLVIVLLLTALPVLAADHQQIELSKTEFTVSTESGVAPLWEQPIMGAGERVLESGTITLHNGLDEEVEIELNYVELPYENTAALQYLNHVYITVCCSDEVLYDGAYSRINDENGLAFSHTFAPDETVLLTVDLRRDMYPIDTAPFADAVRVQWLFKSKREVVIDPTPTTTTKPAATTTVKTEPKETFSDPEIGKTLIAVGAAAALVVIVLIVKKAKKLPEPSDYIVAEGDVVDDEPDEETEE